MVVLGGVRKFHKQIFSIFFTLTSTSLAGFVLLTDNSMIIAVAWRIKLKIAHTLRSRHNIHLSVTEKSLSSTTHIFIHTYIRVGMDVCKLCSNVNK